MLKIRREQYEALREAYRDLYVDRTCDYFRRNWADQTADMEDEQLGDLVRAAREQAEGYGINIEADVVRFTEVRLLLGSDFVSSPQYPWAYPTLTNHDTDGTIKVEQIVRAATKALDKNGGVA